MSTKLSLRVENKIEELDRISTASGTVGGK